MKNKGVIIAIALILITGAGVTVGTRRFIHDKTGEFASVSEGQPSQAAEAGTNSRSMITAGPGIAPFSGSSERKLNMDGGADGQGFDAPSEESGENQSAGPGGMEAAPAAGFVTESGMEAPDGVNASREAGSLEDGERMKAAEEAMAQQMEEGYSNSSVAISPLTGSELVAVAEESVTLEGFQKKLKEIDILVQNMQESEAGSNTDSLKKVADYEYRLWDSELNLIYRSILEGMTKEEAENLKTEEREWIQNRDSAATKAASRYKGGTMESLEYTASLADSTRNRAYELLDVYEDYLKQEEK